MNQTTGKRTPPHDRFSGVGGRLAWFLAWAAGRRPDRFTPLLAAAAALGAGLVLLRLGSYGPGMGWDAVNYITAARNLLAGAICAVVTSMLATR